MPNVAHGLVVCREPHAALPGPGSLLSAARVLLCLRSPHGPAILLWQGRADGYIWPFRTRQREPQSILRTTRVLLHYVAPWVR